MRLILVKGRLCFVNSSGRVIPPSELSPEDRALLAPMVEDSEIEVSSSDDILEPEEQLDSDRELPELLLF